MIMTWKMGFSHTYGIPEINNICMFVQQRNLLLPLLSFEWSYEVPVCVTDSSVDATLGNLLLSGGKISELGVLHGFTFSGFAGIKCQFIFLRKVFVEK